MSPTEPLPKTFMKTDELIDLLATDPLLETPRLSPMRLFLRLLLSVILSLGILWSWHGISPKLGVIVVSEPFWAKMLWLSALALGAGVLAWRWSIPGLRTGRIYWLLVAAYVFLLAMTWQQWLFQPQTDASKFWNGSGSGWMCVSSVTVLSTPILIGVLLTLRELAPTHWWRSGLAAGLLSGAAAAVVYSLRCDETSYGFFLVWYGLGILVVTVLSVLISRWLLRW